jgi:hypothetical protein
MLGFRSFAAVREFISLAKAVLFPCYLLLCAKISQWGWNHILSFQRSRGRYDADFAVDTMIKEARSEAQYFQLILLVVLACVYLKVFNVL